MLQYTVEPTSYLKILTVKTFCVENRHIIGENPVAIALELEGLSYQSVIPDDKIKMLSALHTRCESLKKILETFINKRCFIGDLDLMLSILTELTELSGGELGRLAKQTIVNDSLGNGESEEMIS